MEDRLIDRIVKNQVDPIELVERLKGFSRETIEEYIAMVEIAGVAKDNIQIVRRELNLPDPLLDEVRRMQVKWQKVKSENGLPDPEDMTEEQVLKAVALFQAANALPKELDNDRAKEWLQKAIYCNLCDESYHWNESKNKSKSLLAYFCEKLSNRLGLGKGLVLDKDDPKRANYIVKTSWKPFEKLFGVDGLAQVKKDYDRRGTLPKGHEEIDELFI